MTKPTSSPETPSSPDLQTGDHVQVKTQLFHGLTFTIAYLTEEAGQPMACGPYGCFAINLLEKTA